MVKQIEVYGLGVNMTIEEFQILEAKILLTSTSYYEDTVNGDRIQSYATNKYELIYTHKTFTVSMKTIFDLKTSKRLKTIVSLEDV